MAHANGKPHSADVRAAVLEDYLNKPRWSIRRIARDHGVDDKTAREWIDRAGLRRPPSADHRNTRANSGRIGDVPSADEIARLVFRSITATLKAIEARAVATSDPVWIKGQNAADLAQLEHAQREYVLRAVASLRLVDEPGASGVLPEPATDRNGAVDPAVPFIDNWHIEEFCEHLEAASTGRLLERDILINTPPGTSKSLVFAVLWPAWEWTWAPWTRWLTSSYDDALALRDAVRTRTLMQSEWYRARVSEPWAFTSHQNTKG
jgi:transposase-like protein